MPQFDEKVDVKPIDRVACLGDLRLGDRLSYSRRESGLAYFNVFASPTEGTSGINVRTNFLFHPTWLAKTFKPSTLSVDPITVQKAKDAKKAAEANGQEPSAQVTEIIRKNSQAFTYGRSIYNLHQPALLQVLLGSAAFAKFCKAIDDASPEGFHKRLLEMAKQTTKDVLFVYECRQSKGEDGSMSNQMELDRAHRIESRKDLEAWVDGAKNRKLELLFDIDKRKG